MNREMVRLILTENYLNIEQKNEERNLLTSFNKTIVMTYLSRKNIGW